MQKLPKVYNPKQTEDRVYNLWLKSGFFNPDKLPKRHKKPYCIVIPPPNITGELHMGHALNATVQDILIRWKRLQGYKALWLPGTDHAGIATQVVVEKELKKEGKTRFDLGREKFIERVWQWRNKYGNIILEQFKKLGCSLDWSRTRFTMDKNYAKTVKKAFLHYYKKGWIYQGKRVINWCPRCQTSLSDLELEHKEEKGNLWYIKYPLAKNSKCEILNSKQIPNFKFQIPNYISVATTRPETMLGDAAVAVNPNDKRYKNLVGKKTVLPLVGRIIPIIADKLVDPNFGTGAVKITPAHDLTDYEISLRHKLPLIQVINEEARITKGAPFPSRATAKGEEDLSSSPYQGLKTLEARQKVIEDLKNKGLLEKVEDYTHQVPKCDRCHSTIELIPSEQWFLKMEKLAKLAKDPVKKGKIQFHPKSFEKGYFDWLRNVKDWCISRQIWWGHQLPVWFCQTERISNSQFPISKQFKNLKLKIKNSSADENFIVSVEKPNKCPFCKNCQMKQSADVLDTWFSAALWPFATLGWPSVTAKIKNQKSKIKNDLAKFYPTNVLVTARDIINLWVNRMVFSGMEFMGKNPFKDVYIHATILTKEGKRMSKSLGTGIDPLNLVEKYGADATRFGICWQITGLQDIRFSEEHMVTGKKFCNKLWNASRFVLQQISKSKIKNRVSIYGNEGEEENEVLFAHQKLKMNLKLRNLTLTDKKILRALNKTIKSVNKDLDNFRFGPALWKIYRFFWHDFCDKYIEISKSEIRNPKSETKKVLLYVLLNSLKLLHPFIPFITEEIYQKIPARGKEKCLMIEVWPYTKTLF